MVPRLIDWNPSSVNGFFSLLSHFHVFFMRSIFIGCCPSEPTIHCQISENLLKYDLVEF